MTNEELTKELAQTLLTLEKAYAMMYNMVMENHKRLNRLEKEFLKLERSIKK